jgi:DNA primase
LEEALPIVDYTFNMVTAGLDLNTAKDKSLAVDKLLPIVDGIKDMVRQAHYLQKLAPLAGVSLSVLEDILRRKRPGQGKRRAKKPSQERATQALHPLLSSPVEEYCLTLLLQHPELKSRNERLSPEYFENSENREIFIAWQQANDLSSLKDGLDSTIWEYLDSLITRSLLANQIEPKYANCVLRLREKFLRSLEVKRAEVFALEAEARGSGADLIKLKEEGIEVSVQLGEVFTQKNRGSQ